MPRHVFTQEERKLGGQNRMRREDAQAHQEWAFYCLQIKNPYAYQWIYENKVAPHMRRKEASKQACERAAMQQGQLEQHIGKRKPMKSSGTR